MSRFLHVMLWLLVCVVPDANAQISAPQLEKIHRQLEELRAENAFFEAKARNGELRAVENAAHLEARLTESREEFSKVVEHYRGRIEAMELELQDVISERRRLEAINRHLRLRLEDEGEVEVDQDIDGRIVRVADTGNTVEIDVGHADAAFVGLQLDVLFPHSLSGENRSDAEVAFALLLQDRCRIEVISVDTENRSRAKVLPGADKRSLKVGARLVSPIWHRQQRHNVVFLEDIVNIEQPEYHDLVTQALWEAGLEARQLRVDSDVSELIDGQTRYVVVAGFDQLPERDHTEVPQNYWNAMTVALEFAIPVLDMKRLLIRHPIPAAGSEEALRMLRCAQERRIEAILKRQQEAAENEKPSNEKGKTSEAKPDSDQPGDPFGK